METKLSLNEIKKDLYRTNTIAKFIHYDNGKLVYEVDILDSRYQFPISVVQDIYETVNQDMGDGLTVGKSKKVGVKLADDLGGAIFGVDVEAKHLNRWISKAFENKELMKISL